MNIVKRHLRLIRAFFPQMLPQNPEDLAQFISDICDLYNFELKANFKHNMCVMAMHLPPDNPYVSKRYFMKVLRRAMANEVLFNEVQLCKAEMQSEQATKGPASEVGPKA